MGLLDDAIREHLELKRRHGADPGEVARIEDEALSPAKREAPAASVTQDEPPADVYNDDAESDGPAVAAPEEREAPASRHEPEPEAVYEVGPDALEAEDDPQATRQFSLEESEAQAAREDATAQPPPGEPGEEDVLEETPEFLQETPEHDRLWFEQKPPKDFDF